METAVKRRYHIYLRDIKDMMAFVNAANELEGACEVISGRYRVDAKSLTAVLAVPLAGMVMMEAEQTWEELPRSLRRYLRQPMADGQDIIEGSGV